MSFLWRFLQGLSIAVLSLSLLGIVTFSALNSTLLNQKYIESTLDKAGTYNNLVDSTLNLIASNSTKSDKPEAENNINPETLTALKPIVSSALTPEFLQSTTETILNGTFVWLNGDATEPNFVIKTSDVKAALQTGITNYLQNKVAALPACAKNAPVPDDPFNATCWPKGANVNSEITRSTTQFIDDIPLFEKPEISLQSFDTNNTFDADQPVQKVPSAYQFVKLLPIILAVIALVSILAFVLLARPKSRAWRVIGFTFAITGGILILVGLVNLIFVNQFDLSQVAKSSPEQAQFMSIIVQPLIKIMHRSFTNYSLYFGIAYGAVGVICYIVSLKLKTRQSK